ncbi:MAG: type II toxin-antitoxin system HicB family antitoxin [Patescibacteria group bacterium]
MYTAVYKKGRAGYVAWIEEIPGVSTQGASKAEARENLSDALSEFIAARKLLTKKESARGAVVRERFSIA